MTSTRRPASGLGSVDRPGGDRHVAAGPSARGVVSSRFTRSRAGLRGGIAHGRAASSWAERPSRVVSSCGRPTSWTASGSPSSPKPAGTDAAGLPVTFHSAV